MDATHLAEFHQVEGVIADYGLSLGDLIGVMQAFFTKLGPLGWACGVDALPASCANHAATDIRSGPPPDPAGIHQLRFKPAFNPYTEPSMEVFGFHDGMMWVVADERVRARVRVRVRVRVREQ